MNVTNGPPQDGVVRALLEAMARQAAPTAPCDVQAADYDWDAPCSFGAAEAAALAEFAQGLAEAVSQGMSSLLQGPARVVSAGFQEVYADQLSRQAGQAGRYGVELADESGRTVGLIELSQPGVHLLMAGLLGGGNRSGQTEGADVELTSVETDLLLEVIDAVGGAFSQVLQKRGGSPVRCERRLQKPPRLPAGEGNREYGRMLFRIDEAREEPDLVLLASTGILMSACGAATPASSRLPEELRKVMRQHVENGAVMAGVQLGTASVPVRDIIGLQEGDVLVLSTGIHEPVTLVLNGRGVVCGLPVNCEGHYGLRVTGRISGQKAGKDASDKKGQDNHGR